jgi:hypothetical protein
LYYLLQRRLGGLRQLDPFDRFEAGVKIAERIVDHGGDLAGRRLLEIGTGWRLNTPLALWLMGAEVVTVDLNQFLRPQLVLEDIGLLRQQEDRVRASLKPFGWRQERWEQLALVHARGELSLQLEELPGLSYRAPQDASALLNESEGSFDGTFSYNVLEHIPPRVLRAIFREAMRLTAGARRVSVHLVDHSDHFAHFDGSLTSVNFLRFTPFQWKLIAGNRFAYCNRLRSSELSQLFLDCGLTLLRVEPTVDPVALEAIESGRVPLWSHFAALPARDVAARETWYALHA